MELAIHKNHLRGQILYNTKLKYISNIIQIGSKVKIYLNISSKLAQGNYNRD